MELKTEDIFDLVGNATQKEIAKWYYVDRKTIESILTKDNTSWRHIKQLKRMLQVMAYYRNNEVRIITDEICDLTWLGDQNCFSKWFRRSFGTSFTTYIWRLHTLRRNQLTREEIEALKWDLWYILRKEAKTLRQLSEETGRSISYVRAALKEMPDIVGMHGLGKTPRGYFRTDIQSGFEDLHNDWCRNWKKSMGYTQ